MMTGKIKLFMLISALLVSSESAKFSIKKMLKGGKSENTEKTATKKQIQPTSVTIDAALSSSILTKTQDQWHTAEMTESKQDEELIQKASGIEIPIIVQMTIDSLQLEFWQPDKSNSENSYGYIVDLKNIKQIKSVWKKDLPLKLVTHGWLPENFLDEVNGVFSIKKIYAVKHSKKYNVLSLDWKKFAGTILYCSASSKCSDVGTALAYILIQLVANKLINPSDVHLIGHSLGAHVIGNCGNVFFELMKKKVARITGLDPAGYRFESSGSCLKPLRSLNKDDADYVDVMHTSSYVTGHTHLLGTSDYFPNNGGSQPGCRNVIAFPGFTLICDHSRAYLFYRESIDNENSFKSLECDSWELFTSNKCAHNNINNMGHHSSPKITGTKFYLHTNAEAPFSKELSIDGKKTKK
uniref:Pancreatic lipase-related protein 1 n=1 Tax=Sipha flava TaxID=143950 RepID=A0A2S2QCC7_9HEMI